MKIQKGIVKYKDRNDIVCTYGITDDNTNYYFLDLGHDYKLPNGNIIASTELVEAIDPMYQASHVGVINEEGKVILPFTHKMIRLVDDKFLLVELAEPVSTSVLEANQMRKDPALATKLVSTPALIKEHLNNKMEGKGRYLFNDQFSEATICDLDGNNLLNGEYYSFIAETAGKLYFSKNTAESEIAEISTLPPEVQEDVVDHSSQEINVSEVQVPTEVVENAMVEESHPEEEKFGEELLGENQTVPEAENPVAEEETAAEESVPVEEAPVPENENSVAEEEAVVEESAPVEAESEVVSETVTPVEENAPETGMDAASEVVEEDVPVEEEALKIAVEEEQNTEMEETPGNLIDEADEEEVELDEKVEDSSLDDLFHASDSVPEEEEDPLKGFEVEADAIDHEPEYDNPVNQYSDSIVSDVAKYMNALLEQNRSLLEQNERLTEQNDQLKDALEKTSASRKLLFDKSTMQDKQIEVLKMKVSKLEKMNSDQEKVIEAQTQDRADLEKILSSVKGVLGEDTYSYDSIYSVK